MGMKMNFDVLWFGGMDSGVSIQIHMGIGE